jgi:lipoprotein-releasing system ATP-binding protein
MLVAKNIRKSYGALHVLSGIDIEIREKEIVSIVGASGAGKSTLLHVLGTLDNPDEGTVHIKEEEVFSFSARKLAKFRNREIGFVFQFHNLLPEFTALENVCIPGYMSSSSDVTIKLRLIY